MRAVPDRPGGGAELVACPDCDLLQRLPDLPPGAAARCPRCGAKLWRCRGDALDRPLALALAVAVLLVVANAVPMLGLSVAGRETSTTVLGGVRAMWADGRPEVALLVLFSALLAPALEVGCLLSVLLAVRRPPAPRWAGTLLRTYENLREWSMIEIMLLGVLVALIKIAELATVVPGTALFVLGAIVFLRAAMASAFDPRAAWQRIAWHAAESTRPPREPVPVSPTAARR